MADKPKDEYVDWEFTYTTDGSPRRTFWEDEHPPIKPRRPEDEQFEGYHG